MRGKALTVGLAACSAIVLASAGGAMAADYMVSKAPASGWIVTLGVEGRVGPAYAGADSWSLTPSPLFDLRRAGTPERFRSPRDGFGFALYDSNGFRIGPVGKLVLPRREGDHAELTGLGDVGLTLELGAFVEYWWTPWLRSRVELRNGIGGHHGLVADLTADVVQPLTSQLTLSGGPRMTLASAAALSPYFDVSAAQSAASGLPVYDAGGGVKSVGAGVQLRYRWTEQWATHAFLEYERLVGDAADAPLVAQRGSANQTTVGAGVTYSFNVGGF